VTRNGSHSNQFTNNNNKKPTWCTYPHIQAFSPSGNHLQDKRVLQENTINSLLLFVLICEALHRSAKVLSIRRHFDPVHIKHKQQTYSDKLCKPMPSFDLCVCVCVCVHLIVGRTVKFRDCSTGRRRCKKLMSLCYLRGISGQGNMDSWLRRIGSPVCVREGPGRLFITKIKRYCCLMSPWLSQAC
jgi:hypothetical protein